jgi:hypothetical protein
LNTTIPLVHQERYRLNPNYAPIVKQDIDKLFIASFIKLVEEATWLSSIFFVPKKYEKLKLCVDFKKLNARTKKNPYMLRFTNEINNTVAGHEIYTFLDKFSKI